VAAPRNRDLSRSWQDASKVASRSVRVSSPFSWIARSSQVRPNLAEISAQRAERKRFSHRRMFAAAAASRWVNEEVKVFREQGRPNGSCAGRWRRAAGREARLFRGTRMLFSALLAPLSKGRQVWNLPPNRSRPICPRRRSRGSARLKIIAALSVQASMNCSPGSRAATAASAAWNRGNGGMRGIRRVGGGRLGCARRESGSPASDKRFKDQ